MNVAFFGGSFDPPHIGHEAIVKSILQNLEIAKLFVMPTYLNPFKSKSHFDAKTRLNFTKELFEEFKKVIVCDFEAKSGKSIATIESILYLRQKYKIDKIYLVIGADNFSEIETWDHFILLNSLVDFVVVTRKGHKIKQCKVKIFKIIELNFNISSTKLRDNQNLEYIPTKIRKKVEKLWKKE